MAVVIFNCGRTEGFLQNFTAREQIGMSYTVDLFTCAQTVCVISKLNVTELCKASYLCPFKRFIAVSCGIAESIVCASFTIKGDKLIIPAVCCVGVRIGSMYAFTIDRVYGLRISAFSVNPRSIA